MPPLNPFSRTCLALAIGHVMTLPAEAATITVNSLIDPDDGSNCTLRQAIDNANAGDLSGSVNCASGTVGHDTIDISVSGTVTLTTGHLTISDSLTVNGQGQASTSISGNQASRVFYLTTGHLTLDSVTITDGFGIWIWRWDLRFQQCIAHPDQQHGIDEYCKRCLRWGGADFHR